MKKDVNYVAIMEKYNNIETRKKAVKEMAEGMSMYIWKIINENFFAFKHVYSDLYQEGILAIIENMKKYNPKKAKPTTYFRFYILHAMYEYVAEQVYGVTLYYYQKIVQINRTISYLESLGMDHEAILQELEEIPGHVMSVYHMCHNIVSDVTDEPAFSIYPDEPLDIIIQKEISGNLIKAMSTLNETEKYIVTENIGLYGKKKTYKALAKELNFSMEKTRKIRNKTLEKIKEQYLSLTQ